MMNGYKERILNGHGLKALIKSPEMPNTNLAIGGDDTMSSVPLLIFCDQHLPIPAPVLDNIKNMSYEQVAEKGKADIVTLDNFVTDDFQLGDAIQGY